MKRLYTHISNVSFAEASWESSLWDSGKGSWVLKREHCLLTDFRLRVNTWSCKSGRSRDPLLQLASDSVSLSGTWRGASQNFIMER